ncbi:SpoIIE family protein phosphatase [Actinacidiphila acididurans]|uniref:SpoIIE family protein phosphatase n=1 Tax=Actinacidiphila acididurans TaxID=2784346 RepID=A0ABS2U624_9ACTN|nr:SpoIIE family protein phosphatase [Actinacidiphila acididurans]MBM9509603.1 SpoIIE family protein phosphatase [Actinacidiphila acididurans]
MGGAVKDASSAGLLDAALADTVRRTDASLGGLYLPDPDERVLRLTVVSGFPADLLAQWTRVPLAARLPVADAVRQGRLVWVGTQEELIRDYPSAAVALPYRFSLAAVPLGTAVRRTGALLLVWSGPRPDRLTARRRGHVVSGARRISRLLEESVRSGRTLPLPDQPRVITAGPGPQPLGLAAADFAERLPGGSIGLDLAGRVTFATRAAAELLGVDAGRLMGRLPWQVLPWLDDPVYEDHYRSAVMSLEHTSFVAMRPPNRWLTFDLYPDAGGISIRIVPATTGGRPEPRQPRPLMPGAAPTGAGRLYQLMNLAAGLTEAVGVQDVVDLLADQVMPAFGAHGMVLWGAEAGRLRVMGHRGHAPEVVESFDGLPLDTDLTPAAHALTSGIPSFFDNREELMRVYPRAPLRSGKRAWAFLPLIVSGRPVGAWTLSYEHPHSFTTDERAVLISLAGLVAQALARARLYDAKKDLAHGLQKVLLPHVLPTLPGLDVAGRYLPASHGMDIGGDFYDLIRLDDTTCAAVIGDVQGHNVAAAALMGQVRTAVHAHSTTGTAPGMVLARTNRLLADLDPDLLVSCLYVHLDLAAGRATLSSAGHPPPLLRHPERHTEVLRAEPGPLLGAHPDPLFPTTCVPVPPGSLLALYTDGLVEKPGADPDLSTRGLARHLSRADPADLDAVIDSLVDHARPTGYRTDDIALLLLRLRG